MADWRDLSASPRLFLFIIGSALALLIGGRAPNSARAAEPDCDFQLGFRALRELIPAIVGDCREQQWHDPINGDALQQTTGGLMVWRKADNWTAFTDGSTTWINGPVGLVSRPNGGPLFRWEAAPPAEAPLATGLTHGPLLGAVTDTTVKVWARGDGDGRLQLQVKRNNESWPGRTVGDVQLDSSLDFTGVVEVSGLAPATGYDYRLMLNGAEQPELGGSFRTLPSAGQPGTTRFMLGADMSAAYSPFTILDRAREQRPDFSLLLGDLVYADQPELIPADSQAYAQKYRANWSDPGFSGLTRNVPTFMTWDDHEIMNDYDGGKSGRYLPARAALDAYVASHNPAPLQPGELYFTFQAADVDFFVLDSRSFRSPRAAPDNAAKTMLGVEQKAALKDWLANSRAPFKIIASSVAFHDLSPRADSWNGYGTERAELFDFIRERRIRGVVLLSGDQHWSSLARHDPLGIWEFTATPLAQLPGGPSPSGDPRMVFGYDAGPAFGLIEVDTRDSNPRMTFRLFDSGGQVRHSHTIGSEPPR